YQPPPRPTPFPYTTLFRSQTNPGERGDSLAAAGKVQGRAAADREVRRGGQNVRPADTLCDRVRNNIIHIEIAKDLRGCDAARGRSEEHTSELQSRFDLVCR